jgi:hypothetical protein
MSLKRGTTSPTTAGRAITYYVVHAKNGEVRFYKDENGLLYINPEDLLEDAAALLVQTGSK